MQQRLDCRGLWTGRGSELRRNVSLRLGEGRVLAIEPAAGRTVEGYAIPAFVDAHWHLFWAGFEASSLLLDRARSGKELLALVAGAARHGTGVLRGEKLDESTWADPCLPTLAELDAAAGLRPVFLRRVCGHKALLSSAMLGLLPEHLAQDARATGVLAEQPVLDFDRLFPRSDEDSRVAAQRAAELALSHGVTAVCTMEPLRNLQLLAEHGCAIDTACAVFAEDLAELEVWLAARPAGAPAELLGVKLFLDGAIGAGTAAVACGFADGSRGRLLLDDEVLADRLRRTLRLGLVPVVHAIGAEALGQLDRVSAHVLAELPDARRLALRIEHAEELGSAWPGAWSPRWHRFSMQPNFVRRWQQPGGLYQQRLPSAAARALNPFATVSAAGFALGFGSDGMPFGPLWGLGGAIDHPLEHLALERAAALEAYTLGAAALSGFTELARPIEPSRRADLVVLSHDPLGDTPFDQIDILAVLRKGQLVRGDRGLLHPA
jgi:predicted amidohydrolase YtcJ